MAIAHKPHDMNTVSTVAHGITAAGSFNHVPSGYMIDAASGVTHDQHQLRGQLFEAVYKQDEILGWNNKTADEIKLILCGHIAEQMMKSQHLMFTKVQYPQDSHTTYLARAFMAPDDMVRIVQTLRKNNF